MRKPTPLMRLAQQWHEVTAQLMLLCNPNASDLAGLSAREVEGLRADAQTLSALIGAWQVLHPAAPTAATAGPRLFLLPTAPITTEV